MGKITFTRKIFKANWTYFTILVIVLMVGISLDVEANDPVYKTEICTTDKCKARVGRLNECNGDIKCAVNLTQEASYEYLYTQIANLEKESSKTVNYGLNDAVKFVAKFEGVRLNAYYDGYANKSNRWSIGYGTVSYKGEAITKQEAINRKMAVIEPIYKSIPSCFTGNQKTAITSYMYNTGGNQMNLKYHIAECRKDDVRYIMQVYGHNKELLERRGAELLKYKS